jgi:hypothetical protein
MMRLANYAIKCAILAICFIAILAEVNQVNDQEDTLNMTAEARALKNRTNQGSKLYNTNSSFNRSNVPAGKAVFFNRDR